MSEKTAQQHHRIKFERKTIKSQTDLISEQTKEILKFIEQKHKEK
jgi:hypothetical protein|tara:strand:- start:1000 stop:1134 length:135 start_codon:yes stop_codon:yes gene_type:complete